MKRLTLTDFKRDIKFYWQAMKTRDIYCHLNLKIQAQKTHLFREAHSCRKRKYFYAGQLNIKKRGYEALDEVLEVLLYFQ